MMLCLYKTFLMRFLWFATGNAGIIILYQSAAAAGPPDRKRSIMTNYGEEYLFSRQASSQITGYYHAWYQLHEIELEAALAKKDHSESGALSCGVVRYSHLKNYILSGEPRPDIIIACDDDGYLTDCARTMIRDYFAENPDINLLYADEDRVTSKGEYVDPWLKSDWAPDTFLSTFYFGNIFAIRSIALSVVNPGARRAQDIESVSTIKADSIEEQLARRDEPDESLRSWIYGKLCMKLAQAEGGFSIRRKGRFPIGHIPEVLFHATEKFQAWDSDLIKGSLTGRYDADSAATRLISIILPSKDNPEILRRCVKSVEKHTRIPFELIIVDNGSNHANRQKVQALVDEINENNSAIYVYREMEFNMSAFYNLGASYANGGLLLFLHDDVVVQRHEWLSHLSEKAKLPYVGAVGMKLLYPSSNIIQHAGIMSVQGTPVYKLQYRRNAETQYFGFNKGIRNVLAVTGACMMVRKDLFDRVGGFDEARFPHCYSDIDFCYRIHEQGFYNVVRNNMYLFYHEASAPVEEVRRQRELQRSSELETLRAVHPELSARDPFYHRYLTQNIKEAGFILDAGSLTI